MRIGMLTVLAAIVLAGCVHMDVKKNIEAISTIQPGDPQAQVLEKLGPPDIRHDIDDRRTVVFYRTKTDGGTSAPISEALCTSVAFENGRVVAVGDDPTERWKKEAAEAERLAEMAEQQQRETERAEAARKQAEDERQAKIAALEAQVKPVPASNARLNLSLYRQLLALDPHNERYRQKVDHYEKRLVQQEKIQAEKARMSAEKRARQRWEKAREVRNKKLRQYSGNGTAEMAVHDMGSGSLYVWIKNVSQQVITTHPDHFGLIDAHGSRINCQFSNSLDSVLQPGSISHGKIEYDKSMVPGMLVFENGESGRIEKSFQ